jgi:hypothetical protein
MQPNSLSHKRGDFAAKDANLLKSRPIRPAEALYNSYAQKDSRLSALSTKVPVHFNRYFNDILSSSKQQQL